jgi:hypothetical protein
MSRGEQSTAKVSPALEKHADIVVVSSEHAPIVYWNLCQGVPPIVIESPRVFYAAQAIVVVLAVAVVIVLLLIF